MKKFVFAIFLTAFFAAGASAHSVVLYNISLGFEPQTQALVVSAAQNFMNTTDMPYQFDLNREEVIADFPGSLLKQVYVDPRNGSIMGFRNDNLATSLSPKYSADQAKIIAQKVFDSIPFSYGQELVYGGEQSTYLGTYQYSWYRFVNGVFVFNNFLHVEVDPGTGNVVFWHLTFFPFSSSSLNTTPAITYQVAQEIANIEMQGKSTNFKPLLAIDGDYGHLVWVVQTKSLYPIYAEVDAQTGFIWYSGNVEGPLDPLYSYGTQASVVETPFIKSIYGGLS